MLAVRKAMKGKQLYIYENGANHLSACPCYYGNHLYSILQGNVRLLRLLISKGASCYEKDNEGQTALHLCTRHKSAKCMTLLLRQLSPGEIDDQDKNKVSGNDYKRFGFSLGLFSPLHWLL